MSGTCSRSCKRGRGPTQSPSVSAAASWPKSFAPESKGSAGAAKVVKSPRCRLRLETWASDLGLGCFFSQPEDIPRKGDDLRLCETQATKKALPVRVAARQREAYTRKQLTHERTPLLSRDSRHYALYPVRVTSATSDRHP